MDERTFFTSTKIPEWIMICSKGQVADNGVGLHQEVTTTLPEVENIVCMGLLAVPEQMLEALNICIINLD